MISSSVSYLCQATGIDRTCRIIFNGGIGPLEISQNIPSMVHRAKSAAGIEKMGILGY